MRDSSHEPRSDDVPSRSWVFCCLFTIKQRVEWEWGWISCGVFPLLPR